MDRRFTLVLLCLVLFGATLAVYWPVTANDFINMDDGSYVFNNRHVRNGLRAADVRWALTSIDAANWHPLTWISLQLDAALSGPPPARKNAADGESAADKTLAWHCHLTNVLLHASNTALLLFVLWSMTGAVWRSAVVAALFGLHPLHVESVAWAAERKDVLSTLFFMLTLWAYAAYVKRPGFGRYGLVLLAFVAGLASKPMLVTLPFVLLLLDYWPLDRLRVWQDLPAGKLPKGKKTSPDKAKGRITLSRAVAEKVPLLALTVASCVVTWHAQRSSPAVRSLEEFPLALRFGNAAVTCCLYIGKTFWPQPLAIFYPLQRHAPPPLEVGIAIVSLVSVSVLVFYSARRFPYLLVGWCWYVGTLVPVIGLVQVGLQSMADRYTYIPLIGLFIIIVWGGGELARRWHCEQIALALSAFWLIALSGLTMVQITYWKDGFAVWRHAVDVTVDNSVAHTNLGYMYQKAKDLPDAMRHYEAAVRVNPADTLALNDMAALLGEQGRWSESMRYSRAVLDLDPDDSKAHFNLALALLSSGEVQQAITHFRIAAQSDPGESDFQFVLGRALLRARDWHAAVEALSRAVEAAPDRADYHVELALALYQSGQTSEANAHYREASQLDPHWIERAERGAWELATIPDADGRRQNAARALELALEAAQATQQRDPQAQAILAAAYAAGGDFTRALAIAQNAHELAARAGWQALLTQTEQQIEHYRKNQVFVGDERPKR